MQDEASASFDLQETNQALMEIYGNVQQALMLIHFIW